MSTNPSDPRLYTVRPFSKSARSDRKDVFRIYLSPSTLLLHKLQAGDTCFLQSPGDQTIMKDVSIPVMAWTAPEKIQDNIVQTSKALQDMYSLRLGDKVSIKPGRVSMVEAYAVVLSEISKSTDEDHLLLDPPEQTHWEWFLEQPLVKAEVLCVGLLFDDVELKSQRRSFKIEQINSSTASESLYRASSSLKVSLRNNSLSQGTRSLDVTSENICGLSRELDILNQRLVAYGNISHRMKLPSYYRPRRGGILLYGPPGTGKTLILRKVAEAPWQKVFHVDTETIVNYGGKVETAVRRIFVDARRHQPSVIIIDRLEAFATKAKEHETLSSVNMAQILADEFSRLSGCHILVIAATTKLADIDERLRRPECFGTQIEIPVPSSKARAEILKVLTALPKDADVPMLDALGDRTHGFVGADLDKLVQLAVEKAMKRTMPPYNIPESDISAASVLDPEPCQSESESPKQVLNVEQLDFENAFLEIRPTAMQEVFLDTPKVRWTDIGGQQEIKASLKQAVEWPFKYPEEMARLGIEPKKGLLLYGPPGCSKTLTAKAVATEAGLNFIAVKGAELLSMYVGESERAMREVFRKARAASPSIIFFDEIDAIGASREAPSQHGGLNVVTTMLNELDGIEVLKGVFVLAATNKPETLDPALMRPGRLDTLLYVGLPDFATRKEILQIRVGKMDLSDDVSVPWLAENTQGYSGAEIVHICQGAGYAALEEQERTKERMTVCKRHFEAALQRTPRQITPEMCSKYQKWGQSITT